MKNNEGVAFVLRKALMLILVGLLSAGAAIPVMGETITIASGNFAEPQILAETVKLLIEEQTDLEVDHVRNFSGSSLLHAAFLSGDVDMYITYTGTQFTGVLGMEVTEGWKNRDRVEDYVQEQFAKQFGAHWFDGFGFENTYAVAVRKTFAEEHDIKKVSDLRKLSNQMTIAMDNTFRERAGDGYDDFLDLYDMSFRRPVSMDYGMMYRAVGAGNVDAAIVYSTDGRVAAMDLVVLEDDLGFFPPYDAALVVSHDLLARYSGIKEIGESLAGKIDVETMQRYNKLLEVDYEDLRDVALKLTDEIR
ncbi:MAG: glycine betaine ABC transporter substrate-binding protein [Firmicutes bacterium]|nr:glycine betaine ABC transporter substrate-binding protein [Bacillota bacterium]